MNKDEVKRSIANLIEKYNAVSERKHNEEATKTDFILPLFRILGWNIEDSNEVSKEENISGKRVDYGFRVDGIPKFFLEAKGLDESLDDSRKVKGRDVTYAEQAINYAYYKGCNWAILTNFKEIRVYDAWAKVNPNASFRFAIRIDSLISDFENGTYLLSREAFGQNLLDQKYGMKSRKRPITEQLLLDFTTFRGILSKDVYNLNKSKKLTEEELDEAIQRLFDRLIFIRNCEDRELEEYRLLSALRQWKGNEKGTLLEKLRDIFTYFDETYNSKIFSKHLCDQVDISDNRLGEVLEGLYTTENGSIQYDFSLIDADVLGNIYEQYLGHILKKTTLSESKAKRKSEGIYYTPSYIVQYIVNNTVGELVKKKKIDVAKIKILDPACGSGSFLIKTFDVLNRYYSSKKGYKQNKLDLSDAGTSYSTKLSILKENIFGVDLDKQAVDIAQLNLLLKVAEKKKRLPILQQNIKNGNSLIDDISVVGDKAFNWREEFSEIMEDGGFDVIIGNPPWTLSIPDPEKIFLGNSYETTKGKPDLYRFFIQRGIDLLKEGGRLGFIVPNSWLTIPAADKLRKYMLDNTSIEMIVLLPQGVFNIAMNYIIFILRKEKAKETHLTNVISVDHITNNELIIAKQTGIKQSTWRTNEDYAFLVNINKENSRIIEKMQNRSVSLSKLAEMALGLQAYHNSMHSKEQIEKRVFHSKTKLSKEYLLELGGKNIYRYGVTFPEDNWVKYGEWLYNKPPERFFEGERIAIREVLGKTIIATLLDKPCCTYKTILNVRILDQEYSLRYVLGILNSKAMAFFIRNNGSKTMQELFPRVSMNDLKRLPIPKVDAKTQNSIAIIVEELLAKTQKLITLNGKDTDQAKELQEKITVLDNKLENVVYTIYGLTEEERKVVENSLNG